MKKNLIICTCACLIGLLIALPGCDQQAKKAATPKIVRKKIQDTPVQKEDAGDAKTVASVKPPPTTMPAAKQPDTGPQPPPQAPIAQKAPATGNDLRVLTDLEEEGNQRAEGDKGT